MFYILLNRFLEQNQVFSGLNIQNLVYSPRFSTGVRQGEYKPVINDTIPTLFVNFLPE